MGNTNAAAPVHGLPQIAPHEVAEHINWANDTEPKLLHHVALQHPSRDNYSKLAGHPNTAPETLNHIHQWATENHHSDPEEMSRLRSKALGHPNAPKELLHSELHKLTPDTFHKYTHDDLLFHPNVDEKVRSAKFKELVVNNPEQANSTHLFDKYLENPKLDHATVSEYLNHKDHGIARLAASHPKATEEDRLNFIHRKGVSKTEVHNFVSSNESLSPDVIREAHNTHSYREDGGSDYWSRRNVEEAVAQHPNTPRDVLEDIVNRKELNKEPDEDGKKYYSVHGYSNGERSSALSHPNFDINQVRQKLENPDDHEAALALAKRPDATAEDLRSLEAKYPNIDKTGNGKVAQAIVEHPNYPEDLQIRRAKDKAVTNARPLLSRNDLSENVLKELVSHKNTKLAVDSLDHRSVTSGVVEHASKRKASDVSRAAALHPLSSDDTALKRAAADPKAAVELATSEDPELLRSLHAAHPKNYEVATALIANKNTPTDVVDKLVSHFQSDEWPKENYGSKKDFKFHRHPNLGPDARKRLLFTNGFSPAEHPETTADEMRDHLETLRGSTDPSAPNRTSNYIRNALEHKNLTQGIAKDILSGKYGQVDTPYYFNERLENSPEIFNHEAIKAGLDASPEIVPNSVKHKLLEAPGLDQEEMKSLFKKNMDKAKVDPGRDREDTDNAVANLNSLLRNKKLPPELRKEALLGNHGIHLIRQDALENGEHSNEDLLAAAKAVKPGPVDALSRAYHTELSNKIQARGLTSQAVLASNHPDLIDRILSTKNKRSIDPEVFKAALAHANPEIVSHLVQGAPSKVAFKDDEHQAQIMDSLAEHPSVDVRKAAFKYFSPDTQDKLLARGDVGSLDPEVISSLKPEALGKLKISPDTPHNVSKAILDNQHVSHDQLLSGAAHNDEFVASRALINARHSTKTSGDQLHSVMNTALDKHPESSRVLKTALENTNSRDVVQKVLSLAHNSDNPISVMRAVADHKAVKTADLDNMAKVRGPEYSNIMGAMASHQKSSVKLLGHIAENYPEHLDKLASHPKAASAKVLKAIVEKGDDKSHIALINNDKVPQGVKDILMKNPRIMLRANPSQVTDEQLSEHVESPDLAMTLTVAEHPKASATTLEKAAKHAQATLDKYGHLASENELTPENQEKLKDLKNAKKVMSTLASKADRGLTPETQDIVANTGPDEAAHVIRKSENFSPVTAAELIDRHKDDPESKGKILAALYDRDGLKDNDLFKKMISSHSLSDEMDGSSGSRHIASWLASSETSPGDSEYREVYNKLKAERGSDFSYMKDMGSTEAKDLGPTKANDDASMLLQLAKRSPKEVAGDLAQYKELYPALAQNRKISKETFNSVYDDLVNKLGSRSGDLEENYITSVVNHPLMEQSQIERLYNASRGLLPKPEGHTGNWNDSESYDHTLHRIVGESLSNSGKISPDFAHRLYKDGFKEVLSNKALPEEAMSEALGIDRGDPYDRLSDRRQVIKNPNFKLSLLEKTKLDPKQKIKFIQQFADRIAENIYVSHNDLRELASQMLDGEGVSAPDDLTANLIKHHNTPADVVEKLRKSREISEDDLYSNPAIGGKHWREKKHSFPKGTGLKPGLELGKAEYRPHMAHMDKINQVKHIIPEGGFLNWADFKKDNPKLAANPIVNGMFTSAPKQRLTAEHADDYVKSLPSKNFHVTYQMWNGTQRHNSANPESVFCIENGQQQDSQISSNEKLNGLYRFVQNAAKRGGHPVTPQSIGWARVDTTHPEHWFIDEVQSDLNSMIADEIYTAEKTGNSGFLKKLGITDGDDAKKCVGSVMDVIHGWERAVIQNVIETAKKHGVKKVSIHSGESKVKMLERMGQRPGRLGVTNKFNKIYNEMPKELGFKPSGIYEQVLPTADAKGPVQGLPIQTLDLAEASDTKATPEAKPGKKAA